MPQKVEFLRQRESAGQERTPGLQTRPDAPAAVAPMDKLTRTEIAPEAPGEVAHRDRRLLVLYFDMTSMPQADQLRALSAAEKFIRSQMSPADLMASCSTMEPRCRCFGFHRRAGQAAKHYRDHRGGRGPGLRREPERRRRADTGAAFGQDDSEFNIFTTDRQLSALQTAGKMLGGLNEKKVR